MAGTISVGGLATGLDTNKIIDQLVALERRPLDLLNARRTDAVAHQTALQTFGTKVFAFLTAANDLRTSDSVIARSATSSDPEVLTATAGGAAVPGSTTITVTGLARGAIATSANGLPSATSSVAAASGTFVFRVGTGTVQSVDVDATTTLQGLATKINTLGAGVSASVVNAGTAAAPDYRLRLATTDTGASRDLTIVHDDTTLGVSVTQHAQNATFTVSGFTDPLAREHNTFDDVVPGVQIALTAEGGPVTITVGTDVSGVTSRVQTLVTAFNDLVSFVTAQSAVTQDTSSADHTVTAGPLAFDSAVKTILQGLHGVVSGAVSGLDDQLTVLAQIGITTNRDGTLAFDASKLASALAQDEHAVGELVGGSDTAGGVADRLHDYLTTLTRFGGLLDVGAKAVTDQIASLDDQIDAGQRHLDAFQAGLQATFTNLEVLVSGLQSQSSFLLSALGVGGSSK